MLKALNKQKAKVKREPKARKAPEERIRKEQETRGNEQDIKLIVITNLICLSLTYFPNSYFCIQKVYYLKLCHN